MTSLKRDSAGAGGVDSALLKKLSLSNDTLQSRLDLIRRLVAKPINRGPDFVDPQPALVEGGCVLIGSKNHAADIPNLKRLGVTAVLNCASGGISRLPVDELKENGIRYAFTNVRQDSYSYPILHDDEGKCSKHLEVAKALYEDTRSAGGKVLFFCVAGQNRSAALGIAVMMLFGHTLDDMLQQLSQSRPFILENVGFQKQLVELEAILAHEAYKKQKIADGLEEKVFGYGSIAPKVIKRTESEKERMAQLVEIELLIPGLCTMEVKIPIESTIPMVKKCLVDHANEHLLAYSDPPLRIAKSWVVLAMFGYDAMYDFPLETEAIDLDVQLERMKTMFNLDCRLSSDGQQYVKWTERCRFALVIFSVTNTLPDGTIVQEPWSFVHEERPGAPATLLENNLLSTHLRAWDFVNGQAFASDTPIVFSFANDERDRRSFMKVSKAANEPQQFRAPGEGGILGMGFNAVVHRVQLRPTSADGKSKDDTTVELLSQDGWDAAVKRPFGLSKMLAFLESSSEAGIAKRMRFANSLNSDGRVLYFYGLGVALSANAYNHQEFKFEAVLLAKYEEEFSTYTMRRFMEDYVAIPKRLPEDQRAEVVQLQGKFTIILVKTFLVSLLNAFRDLTLMGVHSFDFNHMNNVLVSRDHRGVRLIDIDGIGRKGSEDYYLYDSASEDSADLHPPPPPGTPRKPSLDIDLVTVLPGVISKLLLGKGRGVQFVTNTGSRIWHAKPEEARDIIKNVLRENFFPQVLSEEERAKTDRYLSRVSEWFYAVYKKQDPWNTWTRDIYDAMRCVDHLPIN